MRRREFITLLGGAAAAWPLAARAQQSPVRPLIGVLSPLSAAAATRNISAFRSGLRDLGYLEGRNATLVIRYGDGAPERMAPLAAELIALKPDVLFAGAKSGALAAHGATRTIPIVTITPENPVAFGLASSIARPGGNVTGTWMHGDDALVGKRLEFLQLAVPGVSRIGLLYNPDDPSDALVVPQLPTVARALGLAVEMFEVRDVTRLDEVSAQVARGRAGIVRRSGAYAQYRPGAHHRHGGAPAPAGDVRLSGVRGCRRPDVLRAQPPRHRPAVGQAVGKILKGESPAELPIEVPTRYELVVNFKVAKANRVCRSRILSFCSPTR